MCAWANRTREPTCSISGLSAPPVWHQTIQLRRLNQLRLWNGKGAVLGGARIIPALTRRSKRRQREGNGSRSQDMRLSLGISVDILLLGVRMAGEKARTDEDARDRSLWRLNRVNLQVTRTMHQPVQPCAKSPGFPDPASQGCARDGVSSCLDSRILQHVRC